MDKDMSKEMVKGATPQTETAQANSNGGEKKWIEQRIGEQSTW